MKRTDFQKSDWLGKLVKVSRVDMYGWTGREHHPEPTDKGSTGIVVRASIDDWLLVSDPKEEYFYVVFDVLLQDGRCIEFIDHEIVLE